MDYYTYFVFIVHPQNEDVLTYSTKKLPTIVHGDNEVYLHTLCEKTESLLSHVYRLVLMRKECETLESSSEDEDVACPDYIAKVLVFEVLSTESLKAPDGFLWIPKEQVSNIILEPMVLPVRNFLRQYSESGLSINESRLHPYSRRGWFKEASSWIRTAAARHGFDIQRVQQITSKAEGSVLRGMSKDDSVVYFKHVGPSAFVDEIRTLQALSKVMPEYFTSPLAVNREREWMLMHDCGAGLPEDKLSMATNRDFLLHALSEWGRIQKRSIPLSKKLVESGLQVKDEHKLKDMLQEMFDNAEWCSVLSEELSEAGDDLCIDETEIKDRFISYSTRLCKLLSEGNIPMALVHGDFNPVNVILSPEGHINFIDFSSTCISFPFSDAFNFAIVCGATEDDLQVYFNIWTDFESLETIKEVYNVAKSLQIVEFVLLFYKRYIAAEQSRKEFARSFLRSMIRVMLNRLANLV